MTLDGVSTDLVVGCDTERNTLQEESGKGQEVACGIGEPENINNSGDYDVVMKEDALIQSSSKVLDLGSTQTDQRKVTPSFEEQKTFLFECKNENLVDYQHITTTFDAENDVPLKMSKTALLSDNTTDLCDLAEQTLDFGNHSLNITNLQSASPSGLTFCCTPSNGHRPRKSLTGDISLNRSFEEQLHAFASMMVNEEGDYNKLLDIYQADVQELKKQYDSEIEKLQQKLKEQAKEMDTKLEEEKKEKEHLSLELEAARLELQYLDLSARSFLSFDVDDLKSFDTNQSVCTVLPIGSLNLNNSCVEKSDKPKEIQKSPDSKVGCKNKIDPEALILEKSLGTGELENQSPNCSLIAGTRKNPPDIQNRQTVIENLGLHAQQFSKENLKLLQHVKDGEREIETSDAVTKDLNEKVEKHKSEFGQETDSSEVHNGTMELEEERTCLFEKLEILAHEKQQLSGRVHDLEKDLVDLSNTTERLKIQLSDLSAVKENFERSSEEWKEKYLQAENELRRAKSENGNIENHALSLESDLDTLQVKFQKLQDQNEEHLKCVSSLRERLDVALEERNRIIQELGSANEDKEEYMELYHQLQRKECEFEASKANTRELLRLLEDEIRALKSELQTAKSITEQLSADAEQLNKKQIDDLQNQMQQIQQEKVILLEKINDLETQARTAINEKTELSRTLECCQFEKQEMVARLNIAQEEVALMRAGIEKLKKQIESDEKKRRHMVEKLKDGERNSDRLNDKIENLERELSMSEENLEGVVIQNETIKEELERVMSQKDILEKETNTFRRKVVEQEKDLLERQEKIIELEAALLNMVNAMEAKEMAQRDLKEESEKVLLALQTQLNELQEQKVLSDERHQAVSANHLEALSLVEQSNTDLLHQLEEAQAIIRNLEASVEKLTLDLENHRQTLDEKTRQILILEEKLEHAGQWEQKFSSELLSFEEERETLNNEKKVLKARVDQLEDQVHAMSTASDSSEKTIADLRTLCGDLQEQLDTSSSENQALLQQVSVLSESCSDLQGRLCDADQRVKTAQETHSVEREALEEQIGELQRQNQESSAFLTAAVSQRTEMEETVANLQKELDVQLQKNNEDTFKYDARLSEADLKQQALVNEIKQHKDKVQDYQEKLTLAEAHLTAQKQELECLKTSNEELNQSLGKSEQQMMELNQIKADISEMKKENAVTCSNLDLWMKSCKRLEQEKGQLEEQIKRHEANLESFQEKPKNAEMDNSSSDLLAELEELKQSLEEKTLEADESVEKYCTLIIETHKLEEANDMLQRQVDLLTMKLKELETNKEVKSSPRKPGALMKTCKGKGEKDRRSTQGAVKQSTKRCRAQEAADEPKYTTPTSQRQTKRVKKTASSTVATPPISDDGHFELDGLPEVVKQGFADIPSGKRSPFVLCRTALPLRKSPRLSAQKPSPSNLSTIQNADLENSPSFPNLTEGGSNSQKLNKTELMQLEAAVRSIELSSPLSAYNKRKAPVSESPVLCQKETRKQSNIEALHDKSESDETCNVQ
uniref:Centromere protein F n=1 Tax=Leptobrachium leishanense TaxID=445787 RepID=A0A8C5PBW9_9ANUR